MIKYMSLVRLVLIGVAVIVIGGLLGWYYFLQGKTAQTNEQGSAAGYGSVAPTFQGSTGSTYANVVSTLGQAPAQGAASSTSRLWQVSAVPVAGFGWQRSAAPSLYFVERSSGYIFNAQTQSRTVTRLTDILRPKIYEASITQDGSVIERSIDTNGSLITFAGKVASSSSSSDSTTTADLIGNALQANIPAIAADPVSDTLFYLAPGPTGVSLVSTSFSGTKQRSIFSSPIVGWHLIAPGDGTLILVQNPLDNSQGYAYQLQKNGRLSSIVQAPGLTVLPRPSSTALIYGSSYGGRLVLFAKTSAAATAVTLPLRSIADKCAWAPGTILTAYCATPTQVPSATFLDDWYKGLVHTSDMFYAVDISAASTTVLYDPSGDTSAQLDVQSPSVDPTGQYIAFMNARDGSLWILRIVQ